MTEALSTLIRGSALVLTGLAGEVLGPSATNRSFQGDQMIEEMCRQTDDQRVATKEMVAIGLQPTCGAAISLTSRLTVLEEMNEHC